MLVENQPETPSIRALKGRRKHRLHQRLPGLEVLAADGAEFFFESSTIAGTSTVRFGAPLANGTPRSAPA